LHILDCILQACHFFVLYKIFKSVFKLLHTYYTITKKSLKSHEKPDKEKNYCQKYELLLEKDSGLGAESVDARLELLRREWRVGAQLFRRHEQRVRKVLLEKPLQPPQHGVRREEIVPTELAPQKHARVPGQRRPHHQPRPRKRIAPHATARAPLVVQQFVAQQRETRAFLQEHFCLGAQLHHLILPTYFLTL